MDGAILPDSREGKSRMDQKAILLIEDAPEIHQIVKGALQSLNATVQFALSGGQARESLNKSKFDLILLDIGLPDCDGFELCMEIKKNYKTSNAQEIPIIFLTAKDEVSDKVTAFSIGAEDYIPKPFHPLELKARVEARLNSASKRQSQSETYSAGPFQFDVPALRVKANDRLVDLTPTEFKLLYFLARHPDRVFSREKILDQVWGHSVHVTDRTVDAHIYSLRKKLGPHGKLISSVIGEGYRYG